MDNLNQQPSTQNQPTTEQQQASPPKNPISSKTFLVFIGVLIFASFVAFTAYHLIRLRGIYQSLRTTTYVPVQPSPTPTVDPTANWKTYTNTKYGYTIKYPEGFGVDELEGVTTIFKGEKLKTPPGSIIDPYPTSLAIYNRKNVNFRNAAAACEAELCQNLNNSAVGQNWRKEQAQINNASGVKVYSVTRKYSLDYYLANSDGSQIVRIPMGANIAESSGVNDENQQLDAFNSLQQILSTFKFLDNGIDYSTLPIKDKELIDRARKQLADTLQVDLSIVSLTNLENVTWHDTCLGLPKQSNCGVKAEIPGYKVTFLANGKTYTYHFGGEFYGRVKSDEQAVCTQDAKLCPDGSYVSRQPPTCEFAKCP